MQELEDGQWLDVMAAGDEEEEVRVDDVKDRDRRRAFGEVEEGRTGCGMGEEEREEGGRGERAAAVGVFEDGGAMSVSSCTLDMRTGTHLSSSYM